MPTTHTFQYCRNTAKGIKVRTETRDLTARTAIKFQCLDCSGGFSKDVRDCQIITCPLWIFRPYQNAKVVDSDISCEEQAA